MNKQNCKSEVTEAQKSIDFEKNKYQIKFETSMGDILLDLYADKAPLHAKNIIGLSKVGYYDGLTFHRVIPNFVIQGGCSVGNGTGDAGYKIKAEFNSEKHEPGVLSMARAQDPNSAGTQFFLCTGKSPFLDNQYTVFGKTADEESLATVMRIAKVPTSAGDKPKEPVTIEKALVIETGL